MIHQFMHRLLERHRALTAIAATPALDTQVISARVLGAVDAYLRGWFAANTARERSIHLVGLFTGNFGAWFMSDDRHRCASASAILNSASLDSTSSTR